MDASSPQTDVMLSAAGTYTFRLSASDGAATARDDVIIRSPAPNQAPRVSIVGNSGTNLASTLELTGTVLDDGLPAPARLQLSWSKVSGPGDVFFSDETAAQTGVRFESPGAYVIRFLATDGALDGSADHAVLVEETPNQPPVIDAGPDQIIELVTSTILAGEVFDDGLPGTGALTQLWEQTGGPEPVALPTPTALNTVASFPSPGVYSFRLTGSDGELSAEDTVTIEVRAANQPPVIELAATRAVDLARETTLAALVNDDGLPSGSAISTLWETISGPGGAEFSPPDSAITRVTVSEDGIYNFRLTASDGELTTQAVVEVFFGDANQAPVVDAGPDQTAEFSLLPIRQPADQSRLRVPAERRPASGMAGSGRLVMDTRDDTAVRDSCRRWRCVVSHRCRVE